jgi:hypothetical protein
MPPPGPAGGCSRPAGFGGGGSRSH